MKVILATALLFFLTIAQAQNFDTGMAAFERQDYPTALQVLGVAAEAGDADAQFMMGRMYARGLGVPQDFVLAHRWYNLAASQGQRIAPLARDAIAESMTPEQIAQAQKMAQEAAVANNESGTPRIRPADVSTSRSAATASVSAGTGSSTSAPVRLVPRAADATAKAKPPVVVAAPSPAKSNNASDNDNAAPVISASSSVPDSTQIQVSESTVARIQLGLRRLGYGVGAPTGKLNEQTRKAIRDYQKKSRLPVDGRATPALLVHLEAKLRDRPGSGGGVQQEQDSDVQWKRLL